MGNLITKIFSYQFQILITRKYSNYQLKQALYRTWRTPNTEKMNFSEFTSCSQHDQKALTPSRSNVSFGGDCVRKTYGVEINRAKNALPIRLLHQKTMRTTRTDDVHIGYTAFVTIHIHVSRVLGNCIRCMVSFYYCFFFVEPFPPSLVHLFSYHYTFVYMFGTAFVVLSDDVRPTALPRKKGQNLPTNTIDYIAIKHREIRKGWKPNQTCLAKFKICSRRTTSHAHSHHSHSDTHTHTAKPFVFSFRCLMRLSCSSKNLCISPELCWVLVLSVSVSPESRKRKLYLFW